MDEGLGKMGMGMGVWMRYVDGAGRRDGKGG